MSRPRAATLRLVSQALFLAGYLALFALTVRRFSAAAPVNAFLKADPLVALGTLLASRTLVPGLLLFALPVVLLTVFAGRAFCGWICPLGSLLDASDWLWFRRRRAARARDLHRLKYYLLTGLLVSALVGASAAFLLDPIVLLTRSLTTAVLPAVQLGLRGAGQALGAPFLFRPLEEAGLLQEHQVVFALNWLALLMLVGVFALSGWGRRFWCRNLCPLGALLGVLSRVRVVNKRVSDACNECGRCALECRGQAISADGHATHPSECVNCYQCVAICPQQALDVRVGLAAAGREARLNLSRRRLMQAGALGLGWAAVAKTTPGSKEAVTGVRIASEALLRPPGALPEQAFLDRCVRCGACMKVCPTNALHPALHEAGLEGFWTPIVVPRIGGCTQYCAACAQACPTGAIEPFTVEEKDALFIGTAGINRSTCIVWNAGKDCLVCDEHCSYRAIRWEEVEGDRRPFVIEEKCVGCGLCEQHCPVQPVAAIRVYSHGDKRDWSRARQRAYRDAAEETQSEGEKKVGESGKKVD